MHGSRVSIDSGPNVFFTNKTWRRLPDGWHKQFQEWMFLNLNCYDAGLTDKNLGIFREVNDETSSSDETGSKKSIPTFARDPMLVAAVVEQVDVTAMKRIIAACYDQSDLEKLTMIHEQEFKQASEKCAFEITPNALMSLWSGCLSAAKAISLDNYWIGSISPWFRFNLFEYSVFPACREDPVFRLGALAAPYFKAWRQEPITLEGVPIRTCRDADFMAWASAPGVKWTSESEHVERKLKQCNSLSPLAAID